MSSVPPPRTDDDKIDAPRSQSDYVLAAKAWATGRRSHHNRAPDDSVGVAIADSLKSLALSAIAEQMQGAS